MEIEKLDLFKIHGAKELFEEIVSAYSDFCESPENRTLLFLLFSLNHLREWIAGTTPQGIRNIPKSALKQHHKFFTRIGYKQDFQIINRLCNRSKHYITKPDQHKTDILEGARAGLARAGDSLGQTYYLVGDRDIRDIFAGVIAEYKTWFDKQKTT